MSNKIKTTKNNKKLWALFALLALFLLILTYFLLYKSDMFSTQTANDTSKAEVIENLEKKQATVDPVASDKSGSSGQQNDYVPPSGSDNITLSALRNSDSSVTVLSKLEGYSDGVCNLKVSNSGKSYEQEAAVLYQRDYSTCAGFTVPVSKLGTGTWTIALTVTSGGVVSNKAITYEVK